MTLFFNRLCSVSFLAASILHLNVWAAPNAENDPNDLMSSFLKKVSAVQQQPSPDSKVNQWILLKPEYSLPLKLKVSGELDAETGLFQKKECYLDIKPVAMVQEELSKDLKRPLRDIKKIHAERLVFFHEIQHCEIQKEGQMFRALNLSDHENQRLTEVLTDTHWASLGDLGVWSARYGEVFADVRMAMDLLSEDTGPEMVKTLEALGAFREQSRQKGDLTHWSDQALKEVLQLKNDWQFYNSEEKLLAAQQLTTLTLLKFMKASKENISHELSPDDLEQLIFEDVGARWVQAQGKPARFEEIPLTDDLHQPLLWKDFIKWRSAAKSWLEKAPQKIKGFSWGSVTPPQETQLLEWFKKDPELKKIKEDWAKQKGKEWVIPLKKAIDQVDFSLKEWHEQWSRVSQPDLKKRKP